MNAETTKEQEEETETMSAKGMNRRQFLQSSGVAAGATAAVASGATSSAAGEGMGLKALDEHSGKTLLKMTRDLYPHDTLADFYYMVVVEALDGEASGNADTAKLLMDGVAKLDSAMSVKFVELSDGNRLAVLKSMESDPFFQKVRGTTVVALYNDPLVWRHFGYEGPSFEYGGYIDRGFDDLRWAGEPSQDASPKAG